MFYFWATGTKEHKKDVQEISARKGIKIRTIRIIRVQEINSFQEKIVFPTEVCIVHVLFVNLQMQKIV